MRKIYAHGITPSESPTQISARDGLVIGVGLDEEGSPTVWIESDEDFTPITRTFYALQTDDEIPYLPNTAMGQMIVDGTLYHIYETF